MPWERGENNLLVFTPPLGRSDGGGVQNRAQEAHIKAIIEKFESTLTPPGYRSVQLPNARGSLPLEPNTQDLLESAHSLLNLTNPSLAQNCCIRLSIGPL